jgi:hypothetical protein
MERLVQVADKMDQELEGDDPLGLRRSRFVKFGGQLVDLVYHAVLRRTLAGGLSGAESGIAEAG